MNNLQRILIHGTGPASIQLAVTLKDHLNCCIGIAGRPSVRSASVFAALEQSNGRIQVSIQNEKHQSLAGECSIDHVFKGYDTIEGNGIHSFWRLPPMRISMCWNK